MKTQLSMFAPADWDRKSIEHVCVRVTSGGTPRRRNQSYYANGVWPWVKTQELVDRPILDTEEWITDAAIAESSAKILPVNTVLLAMYGATVGKLGLLTRPMTCNQACCALIVDDKEADHNFLYYQLLGVREELIRLATGAAQQNLSGALIRSLELPFPKIEEQRAIARVLRSLDDKIDQNRKTSETLEAMARGLFRSWFVDFDPVLANQVGRDFPLSAEILRRFPTSFDEIGDLVLPSGWRLGTLEELAELNPEQWTKFSRPAVLNYLDLTNVKWGRIENVVQVSHEDAPSRAQRVLRNGDTIVGTVRPGNGAFCLIGTNDFTGSTGFAVLRPLRKEFREVVYLAATMPANIETLALIADGAAYPAIPPQEVSSTPMVIPAEGILSVFSSFVGPMLSGVESLRRSSQTLAELRDALLPRLISGELRISDAERVLESA